MSADSKDCLVRKGLLGKADELLVKPFTVPTLLAKLEQVLETASHTLQARGGAVR
jgi:DNA-binding response OmpR family regulator